ncbi:MAG: hypothetical protein FWG64_09495 [Firmicutes bacterium]|nr:hypothetical protein [Bacillota bacterium]
MIDFDLYSEIAAKWWGRSADPFAHFRIQFFEHRIALAEELSQYIPQYKPILQKMKSSNDYLFETTTNDTFDLETFLGMLDGELADIFALTNQGTLEDPTFMIVATGQIAAFQSWFDLNTLSEEQLNDRKFFLEKLEVVYDETVKGLHSFLSLTSALYLSDYKGFCNRVHRKEFQLRRGNWFNTPPAWDYPEQ